MQKQPAGQLFNFFHPAIIMDVKKWKSEEEKRWKATIEQYKTEIGMSTVEINSLSGKGYVKRDGDSVVITERGIGYIEAKIDSAKLTEDNIVQQEFSKKCIDLLNKSDCDLDIIACSSIYRSKYKNPPSEDSLEILKKMLKTANIPKSE